MYRNSYCSHHTVQLQLYQIRKSICYHISYNSTHISMLATNRSCDRVPATSCQERAFLLCAAIQSMTDLAAYHSRTCYDNLSSASSWSLIALVVGGVRASSQDTNQVESNEGRNALGALSLGIVGQTEECLERQKRIDSVHRPHALTYDYQGAWEEEWSYTSSTKIWRTVTSYDYTIYGIIVYLTQGIYDRHKYTGFQKIRYILQVKKRNYLSIKFS